MKRRVPMVAGLALLLAGCIPPRSHDPERYFVLYPVPAAAPARPPGPPVLVAPTGAASFYDTVQIVYSDSPGTRAHYRYSFWTEPPPAVVRAQLAARLQHSGAPRFLLETQVQELFHDASTRPGAVRLTVVARLASVPGEATVAECAFSRAVPAASFDATGAVAAMRSALAAVLDDIDAWVRAEGASPAPRAGCTAPSG